MASSAVLDRVPDHVPDECVWDRDLAEFLHEGDDPYLAAGRLHEGPGFINQGVTETHQVLLFIHSRRSNVFKITLYRAIR